MAYSLHSANTLKEACVVVADRAPITNRSKLSEKMQFGPQTKLTAHAISCYRQISNLKVYYTPTAKEISTWVANHLLAVMIKKSYIASSTLLAPQRALLRRKSTPPSKRVRTKGSDGAKPKKARKTKSD